MVSVPARYGWSLSTNHGMDNVAEHIRACYYGFKNFPSIVLSKADRLRVQFYLAGKENTVLTNDSCVACKRELQCYSVCELSLIFRRIFEFHTLVCYKY